MGQTSDHQADHRDIDKGFAGSRQAFVVLAQAALAVQPSECSDTPSSRAESHAATSARHNRHGRYKRSRSRSPTMGAHAVAHCSSAPVNMARLRSIQYHSDQSGMLVGVWPSRKFARLFLFVVAQIRTFQTLTKCRTNSSTGSLHLM